MRCKLNQKARGKRGLTDGLSHFLAGLLLGLAGKAMDLDWRGWFCREIRMIDASILEGRAPLEARVPLLDREQVAPEAVVLYDKLLADRGCVPNMFKVLGNVPALALGFAALLTPLMGEGALVGWYKELIATRVASLNQCDYCISAHRYLAGPGGQPGGNK
jgi:AhpD family alkylhydroperoxidase